MALRLLYVFFILTANFAVYITTGKIAQGRPFNIFDALVFSVCLTSIPYYVYLLMKTRRDDKH